MKSLLALLVATTALHAAAPQRLDGNDSPLIVFSEKPMTWPAGRDAGALLTDHKIGPHSLVFDWRSAWIPGSFINISLSSTWIWPQEVTVHAIKIWCFTPNPTIPEIQPGPFPAQGYRIFTPDDQGVFRDDARNPNDPSKFSPLAAKEWGLEMKEDTHFSGTVERGITPTSATITFDPPLRTRKLRLVTGHTGAGSSGWHYLSEVEVIGTP